MEMGQVFFVVWRESVEAILVVGIVYAWLRHHPSGRIGLRYLWSGVAAGLLIATGLAAGLMGMGSLLSGSAQETFQTIMVLVASGLIVQMVIWMRRHGAGLSRELRESVDQSIATSQYTGIAVLVAIAVAREGAETVVFLYGIGAASISMGNGGTFALYALAGFGVALVTFYILQLGSRVFSWRHFFRVSEALLLLLAGSLLVSGVDRLIGMGWLPAGMDPVWSTPGLLDDATRFGGLVAALTGYRAYPALTDVIALAAFWVIVVALLRWSGRRPPRRTATAREQQPSTAAS
ncbi:FTR1 family iron permease [Arhodomonas aquaeolei]|uniref:FTR1 family iron permease n=1 Tax=Arhodomonas aquaeolei TaxID=2369 RepID=UPI0003632889|nr:FTR1 family protein [Arhodomonas aquaeolei]